MHMVPSWWCLVQGWALDCALVTTALCVWPCRVVALMYTVAAASTSASEATVIDTAGRTNAAASTHLHVPGRVQCRPVCEALVPAWWLLAASWLGGQLHTANRGHAHSMLMARLLAEGHLAAMESSRRAAAIWL
jgi:hypothetical protein